MQLPFHVYRVRLGPFQKLSDSVLALIAGLVTITLKAPRHGATLVQRAASSALWEAQVFLFAVWAGSAVISDGGGIETVTSQVRPHGRLFFVCPHLPVLSPPLSLRPPPFLHADLLLVCGRAFVHDDLMLFFFACAACVVIVFRVVFCRGGRGQWTPRFRDAPAWSAQLRNVARC